MTFKVGNRVRRVRGDHHGMRVGDEATVMEVREDNSVRLDGFDAEKYAVWHAGWTLEIVTPVITVTRREVNPGTYGPLRVLGTTQLPDTSSPAPRYTTAVDIELTETTLDADQLAVLVAHLQEIIGALRDA